ALAAAVFAVLALPLVLTQVDRTAGYRRPDELVRELSATTGDLWQLSPAAHGAGLLPWVGKADLGEPLYPGTVLMLLGVGGFALAYARLRDRDRDHAGGGGGDRPGAGDRSTAERVRIERRVVLFLVSGACLARLLSLGLNVDVGGTGPYALVRAAVPGFGSLRSPFRFAVLVEVFLVALSAYGLDALWRWRPGRRVAWGAVAAVAVVVAGVAEVAIAPVRLLPVDRREPDWAAWLDRHVADGATLAFLPAAPDNGVASYEDTARAMLVTLDLHDDTVNGYSGLFPADAERLEEAVRDYPSDEADALLRRHDVADLVVDAGWLADDPVRRPWLEARYRRVFTGDDAVVYAVP
ncbi:MAG TPA: hypothetical protein VF743_05495, partial [Acidimicrobiales bacterium]